MCNQCCTAAARHPGSKCHCRSVPQDSRLYLSYNAFFSPLRYRYFASFSMPQNSMSTCPWASGGPALEPCVCTQIRCTHPSHRPLPKFTWRLSSLQSTAPTHVLKVTCHKTLKLLPLRHQSRTIRSKRWVPRLLVDSLPGDGVLLWTPPLPPRVHGALADAIAVHLEAPTRRARPPQSMFSRLRRRLWVRPSGAWGTGATIHPSPCLP